MSSKTLQDLIQKFPREKAAIEKLEALRKEATSDTSLGYEFTQERFFDRFSLSPTLETAGFLAELEERGVIHRIIRVESRAGGGIADYDSLVDVPDTLHDFRTDKVINVGAEDLRVLYTIDLGKVDSL